MPNPEPIDGKGPVSFSKRTEHWLKTGVFQFLRVLLKKGRPALLPLDAAVMKRVLFLRPETKIGDMVISLPVIDRFKELFPHVKVSIFCSPRNVGIIRDDPRFEKVFLYRKGPGAVISELRKIRREKFDCVLDLLCDDSVTALFMSQWAAPGVPRIGVGKQKYARFYDFNAYTSLDDATHIIGNTMRLLEAFGVETAGLSGYATPFLKADVRQKASAIVSKMYPDGRPSPLIGLNLSAGAPSRYWGEDNHAALLSAVQARHPLARVLIFTTPAERDLGLSLCRRVGQGIDIVPDKLSIQDVTALLPYLDVLITPDTSLVHLARGYRVPVVAMYPGFRKNLVLWHPYGQIEGAVLSHNIGDIFDIQVSQVLEVFDKVMATAPGVRRP